MTVIDPLGAELSGHIIIVGLHGIGLRVVEQLVGVGRQVVVVDDGADDRSVRLIGIWNVGHIVGNAARPEVLELAGVTQAAAIVCLEPNELRTLEVALLAREINDRIRVIVRSSNVPVGEAIGSIAGARNVLDAAELSAPAFVDAVLRQKVHDFVLGGESFRVVELSATQSGSLRELYGDLVPVAVSSGSEDVSAFPGRDAIIEAGDRLGLLGTPRQFEDAGLTSAGSASRSSRPAEGKRRRARRPESWFGSIRSLWLALFYGADRALKTTLAAVLVLGVIAVIVIDFGYVTPDGDQLDVVDSVYTTVQTIVTVGYGDFPFGDQPTYLRIFDIVLMLVGTALIAIAFAQFTDLLVSRRIAETFGAQRASTMRHHVIVVGLGAVGMRVVDQLRSEGKRVAVIDKDPPPRNVARARALNVPVVVADATDPDALASANLQAASAVAVLTSNDLANIETGLAVRGELGELRDSVTTVLRLFDRHLSQTVKRAFGFREVRSTAALAAPWFVAAALGLEVNSSLTVAGQTLMVGKMRISGAGRLAGLSMLELRAGVRVVAIQRAGSTSLEHPPRRGAVLARGDHAYLIGPHEELIEVLVQNQ